VKIAVFFMYYCFQLLIFHKSLSQLLIMKPLYADFITTAKTIIETHYGDETFGCPELCEVLKMSRSHVHRKLVENLNLSCSEFIKQVRLEKAKELLSQTDHAIHEIAYKVGFSDANYFSRIFSGAYGISPTQHRQQGIV
jgi:AraC-like DNA-binding protein